MTRGICAHAHISCHMSTSKRMDAAQSDPRDPPVASSSILSPPSNTSAVWQHFGSAKDDHRKLLNDSQAICKLCGQKVAHGGGTTNLKNHLRTKHYPTYNELIAGGSLTERERSSLDKFIFGLRK